MTEEEYNLAMDLLKIILVPGYAYVVDEERNIYAAKIEMAKGETIRLPKLAFLEEDKHGQTD